MQHVPTSEATGHYDALIGVWKQQVAARSSFLMLLLHLDCGIMASQMSATFAPYAGVAQENSELLRETLTSSLVSELSPAAQPPPPGPGGFQHPDFQ
jgi:hypothetical protein